jgi:hypothetical protein
MIIFAALLHAIHRNVKVLALPGVLVALDTPNDLELDEIDRKDDNDEQVSIAGREIT